MTTDAVLVDELGLAKSDANRYAPYFTGWKSMDWEAHQCDRTPDESKGYVGQLVQWIEGTTKAAYVNLPGGQSGVIFGGECLLIGEERLYEAPSTEVMGEMLREGLKKLQAVVAEYKEANATS